VGRESAHVKNKTFLRPPRVSQLTVMPQFQVLVAAFPVKVSGNKVFHARKERVVAREPSPDASPL